MVTYIHQANIWASPRWVGFALATDFASCSAFSSRAVHKAKGRPRPTRFEGVLSGFHLVFSSSQRQFLTTKLFQNHHRRSAEVFLEISPKILGLEEDIGY